MSAAAHGSTCDESGVLEVYVQPFPPTGAKSTKGGGQPRWRRDGKELFYLAADKKLMPVEVTAGASFESGIPKPLFDTRVGTTSPVNIFSDYDVTADRRRFLVSTSVEEATSAPITWWSTGRPRHFYGHAILRA